MSNPKWRHSILLDFPIVWLAVGCSCKMAAISAHTESSLLLLAAAATDGSACVSAAVAAAFVASCLFLFLCGGPLFHLVPSGVPSLPVYRCRNRFPAVLAAFRLFKPRHTSLHLPCPTELSFAHRWPIGFGLQPCSRSFVLPSFWKPPGRVACPTKRAVCSVHLHMINSNLQPQVCHGHLPLHFSDAVAFFF